jgi:hypothetical protein
MGPRTRKPPKKCQADSTDESSPLQNPIIKPKAKTKPKVKGKMMNPIQKRLLRNWPPTNHVANSDMK